MDEYKKKWNEAIEKITGDIFINDREKVVLLRWLSSKANLVAAELGFEIPESKGV